MARAERRACPRTTRASTRWQPSVLVRPGRDARLVDVSDAGALIEIGTPLRPGTHVQLQLRALDERVGVRGHVTRCYVAALGAGGVRYRGAIAFDVRLSSLGTSGSGYPVPMEGTQASTEHGHTLPIVTSGNAR